MADGWTVARAREELARTGLPVDRLDKIIQALPGLQRIGEGPSGERGGRGQALYDSGQLRLLHAALSPWLTARPDPGGDGGGRDVPVSGDT